MKTLKIIAGLILLSLLAGCAAADALYDRQVVEVPGVTIRETNQLSGAVIVHEVPAVYVTNLVPRVAVETGIKAAGAVPAPWAGTVALALGWLYSAYASVRNKKVATALAQSVQVGREFLQSTPEGQRLDAAFKERLQRHQEFIGVADQVKSILDHYVPNHTRKES